MYIFFRHFPRDRWLLIRTEKVNSSHMIVTAPNGINYIPVEPSAPIFFKRIICNMNY